MPGWIKTIVDEVWGLFVDDLALVVGAMAVVAATAVCVAMRAPDAVCAPILALGLAAAVLFSVWRRARRKD